MEPNAGLSNASKSKYSKSTSLSTRYAVRYSYSHAWLPSDTPCKYFCKDSYCTICTLPSHLQVQVHASTNTVLAQGYTRTVYEYIRSRLAPCYLLPTKESPRGRRESVGHHEANILFGAIYSICTSSRPDTRQLLDSIDSS